jgi:hypothetical protein
LKIEYPSEFLPASIASAGLGILSAIVVNEIPTGVLAGLSSTKQGALRILSGISFVALLAGLGLWLEIAGHALQRGTSLTLPDFSLFGWGGLLTYAALFYITGLLLNEAKAGASK